MRYTRTLARKTAQAALADAGTTRCSKDANVNTPHSVPSAKPSPISIPSHPRGIICSPSFKSDEARERVKTAPILRDRASRKRKEEQSSNKRAHKLCRIDDWKFFETEEQIDEGHADDFVATSDGNGGDSNFAGDSTATKDDSAIESFKICNVSNAAIRKSAASITVKRENPDKGDGCDDEIVKENEAVKPIDKRGLTERENGCDAAGRDDGQVTAVRANKRSAANCMSVEEVADAGDNVDTKRDAKEPAFDGACARASHNLSLETLIYPNELLIGGGNSNAFEHKTISDRQFRVTYSDMYHVSLERYVSDVVLEVAADQILRENGCTTEAGWIWMHETDIIADVLGGTNHVKSFSVPRMESILSSSVLFVPLFTYASEHWSMLVLFNMKSVFDAVLNVRAPNRGRIPPAKLNDEQPKPFAVHLDSFSSSGHKSLCKRVVEMIAGGLSDVWKRHYPEDFERVRSCLFTRTFVSKVITVMSAKVGQQEDRCTCGWRALDAVRLIAERKEQVPDRIEEILGEEIRTQYVAIADRTLKFMQEQSIRSGADTPSVLYRTHLLLDEICCSAFNTDLSKVNDVMITYFDDKDAQRKDTSSNKKKIARAHKFEEIYYTVGSEMVKRGLAVRQRGSKKNALVKSQCEAISRYLIHFPRGAEYARCLFYTRNNYPTSILVCTNLTHLFTRRPRAFGHEILSFASRVTKSRRVIHQMAMFLD